jgi:hypothetical protein
MKRLGRFTDAITNLKPLGILRIVLH